MLKICASVITRNKITSPKGKIYNVIVQYSGFPDILPKLNFIFVDGIDTEEIILDSDSTIMPYFHSIEYSIQNQIIIKLLYRDSE